MTRRTPLPIVEKFDETRFVLLQDLTYSLASEEMAAIFIRKMGEGRGRMFMDYARALTMESFVKVFCIEPVAQYKPADVRAPGRGTHVYEIAPIEKALLFAFNTVNPPQVPAPVELAPLPVEPDTDKIPLVELLGDGDILATVRLTEDFSGDDLYFAGIDIENSEPRQTVSAGTIGTIMEDHGEKAEVEFYVDNGYSILMVPKSKLEPVTR